MNQLFEMATRTCRRLRKGYCPSSAFNILSFTLFRAIFLFKVLDELYKPPVLPNNPIYNPDAHFLVLFVAKYTKNDL